MKKLVWAIIILAVLGVGGYWGYQQLTKGGKEPYETFIKPRVEMSSFQISSMTREKTVGQMKVLIDNPAPVGFKADSLSYQFFIAGKKVMESTYPKPVALKSSDSTLLSLPFTMDNIKLVNTLKSLENKGADSVNYTIRTQVYSDLPFLKDKPLEFEVTKKWPLYLIPEVKLVKADIKKLGLNKTKVIMKTEITNENGFPYRFRDTHYRVTLDGDEFAEGHIDSTVNIPAHGKAVLELPMEVKLKEAGEVTWEMLTKPETVDYGFVFQTKIVDKKGNNTFENSKVVLENHGKLKELLQEAKEVAEQAQGNKKEEKEEKQEKKKEEKREERREKKKEKQEDKAN